MLCRNFLAFSIIALCCFRLLRLSESKLPQDEVDALEQIASTMGSTYWEFDADTCTLQKFGLTEETPAGAESNIECQCNFPNDTYCHVINMVLKGYSLPGMLPPQLVMLPYLKEIDFALNYLNGTIPSEWASTKLTSISLLVNRLSGGIPKVLANITTLEYLFLEGNQFSGDFPPELGNLINLQTLVLSSNQLTGTIPETFAGLSNLTDFRINDNNFSGKIPDFIQNWSLLERLEMHASGLEGPIPANISSLKNLKELRISDLQSPSQSFPLLSEMVNMQKLVLRNCNISGEIPPYIWTITKNFEMLDVSFNKLVGEIPATITAEHLIFVFLTGNMLSGDVPDSILRDGINVDLSYNNLTWQGPQNRSCREDLNLHKNLFRSSSDNNELRNIIPCANNVQCSRYSTCFRVNSGGKDISIKENNEEVLYIGDEVAGGSADYFHSQQNHWGFSSTGDFMDDNDKQNTRYTVTLESLNMSELYTTARVSPLSLTYFHYCMENGNYTVNLHFAETQFTNDRTYKSLGKRIFNVYIQERLVLKDFNIEDEAHFALTPLVKPIFNVSVTNNILEIRFYWAGKGTTRIPDRGVYGPLISAISVVSDSKPCPSDSSSNNRTASIIIGVVVGLLCLVTIVSGILWWNGCFKRKLGSTVVREELPAGNFTLKQITAATDNFNPVNKIGEGGFGPVYKGQLPDETVIAVKQLSSKSRQGNREFLNEIGMISCLQHPNLVKLHGCCIEGDQLLLVYEYMENNSLARALFGSGNQLKLDWHTRLRICIGIARGLAFLHEESRLKIVHRDIKATNVLLDGNLNPKISDFGLARLDEEEKTHISTRVAGTIGYMAPEYALWGYLTYKADVYSYGVVVLEVVSGKNNSLYVPNDNSVCLLDWACHLQQNEKLMNLVDEKLGSEVDIREAETVIKVALLCTNASASLRPTMSEVVEMLEGRMSVPEVTQDQQGGQGEDLRFKAMRDLHKYRKDHSSTSTSQTQNTTTVHTYSPSSTSEHDLYEVDTSFI